MRDVVICDPVRSPVGRFGGALAKLHASELATQVVSALLERTAIPKDAVDDLILGHCYPTMEAPAIGRVVALDAGLPVTVPGLQLDRRCGSGLQAILDAAMRIQTGVANLVIAGGTESMSNAPLYSVTLRSGVRGSGVMLHDALARGRLTAGGQYYPIPGGMIETAENLRAQYKIPRSEQDQLALLSHQRAVRAQDSGIFADEIVPIAIGRSGAGSELVAKDEHPRADTTLDTLASLRPVMFNQDVDATVTAGNASGQNDGAAACIVTHPERAQELGLRPLARLVSWAVAGVPPETMGIGPVAASALALQRAGLRL